MLITSLVDISKYPSSLFLLLVMDLQSGVSVILIRLMRRMDVKIGR